MRSAARGTKVFFAVAFGTWLSRADAQTWTNTSAPRNNWTAVAGSADGRIILAGTQFDGVYISTDAGATWAKTSAPDNSYPSVACSADGVRLVAAVDGGHIYTSTNSGAIWTPCDVPTNSWHVLASFADGTKLFAGFTDYDYGGLYISTDYGMTWTLSRTITNDCLSVAGSPDGAKLLVVTRNYPSPGGAIGSIYSSADSGITWSQHHTNILLNLVASSDGIHAVLAVSYGGGIQGFGGGMSLTTNAGESLFFNTNVPGAAWSSIVCSADGTKFVATIGGVRQPGPQPGPITGPIYASTDSGLTWTPTDSSTNFWSSVASSADGCKLFAVVNGGGIYTSRTMPVPVLFAKADGKSLRLSWTVPSLSFALEQSSNLASGKWTVVGATPVLNYTNLQFEVVIPRTSDTIFYRLASQ
jgi:hypothetical protein